MEPKLLDTNGLPDVSKATLSTANQGLSAPWGGLPCARQGS